MAGRRLKIISVAASMSNNTSSHINALLEHADVTLAAFERNPELPGRIQLPMLGSALKGPIRYFAAGLHLAKLVRDLKPDIVESHFAIGFGSIAAFASSQDCIFASHCVGSDVLVLPERSIFYRILLKMTLARADLILGYGRHIIDAIKPFIAQDKDIVTWIRGIPLAPRAAYRKINPENQLRIATTRKLWRWYRHDLIIRAVSQLKKSGINARIDIYGDGEAKGELGLIATKLGVADACVFHDYVSSERIARALPESELYVSTVPSDGASASLMEAFYLGLFPIVPDIPGNRYFADKGMYIGLYHPGDLDSLYSAIMSYWRHRDEHQWMIDSNYQRILELGDINKNIKILLNLYNDKFTEKRNLALKSPSGSTGMLHSDQKKRSRME